MRDIVVIDSRSARGKALVRQVLASDPDLSVWRISQRNGAAAVNRPEMGPCPLQPDVAFIHYRNDVDCGDDDLIPEGFDPAIAIWYGADGAETKRGKKWNIRTCLQNERAVQELTTAAQVSELLDWCNDPDRNNDKLPRLLQPERHSGLLEAISVLCEGYLAVFVARTRCDSLRHPHHLQLALEIMKVAQLPARTVEQLASLLLRVRTRAWWREPFDAETFTDELNAELTTSGHGGGDAVVKLAATIFSEDAQPLLHEAGGTQSSVSTTPDLDEADLVARAFCQIHNILHRNEEAGEPGT